MEKRKDTEYLGEKLPQEYLGMIADVFKKNFSPNLKGKGKNRETFVVFGQLFPDEVLLAVSLKNPQTLRMTTCYASIDFPPPSLIPESGAGASPSASEAVQMSVNSCVDVVAGFFQTFFEDERPIDYDAEYKQDWSIVDLDKTTRVYLRINRDNLELEAASDDFLAQHEALHEFNEYEEAPSPVEESSTEETEAETAEESEESEETEAEESVSENDEDNMPSVGSARSGKRPKKTLH